MAHRHLSSGEWTGFLGSFADAHRSWTTSVQAIGPDGSPRTLASNRRLGGVTVCPILDHGNAIEVWAAILPEFKEYIGF